MQVCTHKEGDVSHRMVYILTPAARGGSPSFAPLVCQGIEAYHSVCSWTHNRWVAILEAVKKGTFDDKGGEAVTEFILYDKVGDSDPITGENVVHPPFKRPRFMTTDFDPVSDNKISGGQ